MNKLLRRSRITLLLALTLALILPGAALARLSGHDVQGEHPSIEASADKEAVPGEIIVKFEDNVGKAAKADVRRAEGLEKKNNLDIIDAEVDKVTGQPAEADIRALERRTDVEYAEPNL